MQRKPKYLPRRTNMYVPRCDLAVDIIFNAPHEVRFGPMAVASATAILSAQSIATAGTATLGGANTLVVDNVDPVNTTSPYPADFPYGPGFGRTLQLVASGASTATVTVKGKDYWGQPMTEAFTANGATIVQGKKAFKYIDSVTWTATASTTINLGTGAKFGLPYRMDVALSETTDGVAAAAGTLVTPDLTDPATATTGDPRGLYTPTTTPDGTKFLSAFFYPNRNINTNGNGGLMGLAHFGS